MTDMRYFIVDDDPGVRSMLMDIIEDEGLGDIAGEAEDGAHIHAELLELHKVDVLLIDLLMPQRDGIQTVRALEGRFEGKIVMISQIESKNMIGEAYSLGIEYYITKPINRLEILSVLRLVSERLRMQQSIADIQRTLQGLSSLNSIERTAAPVPDKTITTAGHFLLSEMGMIGEAGSRDLLDMLEYLEQVETDEHKLSPYTFPSLKDIFQNVAIRKLGRRLSRRGEQGDQGIGTTCSQGHLPDAEPCGFSGINRLYTSQVRELCIQIFRFHRNSQENAGAAKQCGAFLVPDTH